MLRREIQVLKSSRIIDGIQDKTERKRKKEPVARFLKSYAVFIADHSGKEDIFFELVERKQSISDDEDRALLQHYKACINEVDGQARIDFK